VPSRTLQLLLQAKAESDRRNYPAKHAILRALIQSRPQEWVIDSQAGDIVGLTHTGSNFRIHMPLRHMPEVELARLEQDKAAWDCLPHLDFFLSEGPADKLLTLQKAAGSLSRPELQVLYDLDGDRLWTGTSDQRPPDYGFASWATVKAAHSPFLRGITDLVGLTDGPVNVPYGGARPLTATLMGGLAGAGLGYLGGHLAENLLPEQHFEKGRLRKILALLGGGVGATPGLLWGLHSPDGWLGNGAGAAEVPLSKAGGFADDERFNVDDFDQALWSRADPYTPASLRAGARGLVDTASLASGGSALVGPSDIARVALGLGSGWTAGWAAGKVLAGLAGLKPEAQAKLQQAGTWAGLLKAVIPTILGG
jgi:hypothetical protein